MSGPIGFLLGMNKLSYYNKMHLPWTGEELTIVKQQYNEDGLDIIQIGNIHYKTPGQVSYLLRKLGMIDVRFDARGYDEYIKSELFQEIQRRGDAFKKELKQQDRDSKKDHVILTSRQEQRQERRREMQQTTKNQQDAIEMLSAEVNIIKNDIKEILRLMNALYEFENQ